MSALWRPSGKMTNYADPKVKLCWPIDRRKGGYDLLPLANLINNINIISFSFGMPLTFSRKNSLISG